MLNGGSMVWGFCVYFVYMIPLETDVLRKHRFQKSYLIGSDTHFKYKSAFLAIQFICDRRIQCETKHVGNSVFYM